MDIHVGHQHIKTDRVDLYQRAGHRGDGRNIESMLFQKNRQREPNIIFVVNEENTRTLSRLAGAGGGRGSDALVFGQASTLPLAMKGFCWLFGDLKKGAYGQILKPRPAVQ